MNSPDGVPAQHVTTCPQVLSFTVKFPFRVFRSAHPQCSAVFSDLRLFLSLHHQVSRILGSFRRDVNQSLPRAVSRYHAFPAMMLCKCHSYTDRSFCPDSGGFLAWRFLTISSSPGITARSVLSCPLGSTASRFVLEFSFAISTGCQVMTTSHSN
jgi:hypothetical protein